jgi:hypothetical protein
VQQLARRIATNAPLSVRCQADRLLVGAPQPGRGLHAGRAALGAGVPLQGRPGRAPRVPGEATTSVEGR